MKRPSSGFTLVELIIVMVIIGIIAGVLSMMLAPAFQSYATVQRRASLTHHADTALRRMLAEVRSAVPNSLRLPNGDSACMEMVPTSGGGRFRTEADPTLGVDSRALDLSQPGDTFDVLTALNPLPAFGSGGDWVVIGNQNTEDVYTGTDRARIQSITPMNTPATSPAGLYRVTLAAKTQFPYGYDGGRFNIVPSSQQAVTYFCSNQGLDSARTGTGKLLRYSNYGFFPAASATCPPPASGNVDIVATKVERCNFIYNPSQGATQQSGFVQLQVTLTDNGESATLTVGAQVENTP